MINFKKLRTRQRLQNCMLEFYSLLEITVRVLPALNDILYYITFNQIQGFKNG